MFRHVSIPSFRMHPAVDPRHVDIGLAAPLREVGNGRESEPTVQQRDCLDECIGRRPELLLAKGQLPEGSVGPFVEQIIGRAEGIEGGRILSGPYQDLP